MIKFKQEQENGQVDLYFTRSWWIKKEFYYKE